MNIIEYNHRINNINIALTLTGYSIMAKKKEGKISAARKLWKQTPTATIDEFMKEYEKLFGDTISQPAVYAAKRDVGLTKKRSKNSPKPTIDDLKLLRTAAARHGGPRKMLASLDALEAVAESVGGFSALRDCLEFLNEK